MILSCNKILELEICGKYNLNAAQSRIKFDNNAFSLNNDRGCYACKA